MGLLSFIDSTFGGRTREVSDAHGLPVQLSGSKVEECQNQDDADANVLTFAANISALEIYHNEATAQEFTVNGLTLTIASGGWRSPIGGTPAATVTIPAGVDCIVSRLV